MIESQQLSPSEAEVLIEMVRAQNEYGLAAFEIYAEDHDISELPDTLVCEAGGEESRIRSKNDVITKEQTEALTTEKDQENDEEENDEVGDENEGYIFDEKDYGREKEKDTTPCAPPSTPMTTNKTTAGSVTSAESNRAVKTTNHTASAAASANANANTSVGPQIVNRKNAATVAADNVMDRKQVELSHHHRIVQSCRYKWPRFKATRDFDTFIEDIIDLPKGQKPESTSSTGAASAAASGTSDTFSVPRNQRAIIDILANFREVFATGEPRDDTARTIRHAEHPEEQRRDNGLFLVLPVGGENLMKVDGYSEANEDDDNDMRRALDEYLNDDYEETEHNGKGTQVVEECNDEEESEEDDEDDKNYERDPADDNDPKPAWLTSEVARNHIFPVLVSEMMKEKILNETEGNSILRLFQQGNASVSSALDRYDSDHDMSELVDTLQGLAFTFG
ncbi:unnamed protein product [Sphagnum jensenii]|uniref:Uncharacterized protein n=1 Tax=Sphagnum jensenii TaxID=128206 RepID=A0ABP0VDH4_9BRYO